MNRALLSMALFGFSVEERRVAADGTETVVEMNPRHMMSGLHSRAKEAWIEPHGDWSPKRLIAEGFSTKDIENFYERAIITQHVPWLDGARECLMTLATWLEGL